jgi:hypothetical protein
MRPLSYLAHFECPSPDTLLRPVTEDPIDLPDVQQDVAGVLEDDRTIAFDMLG